MFSRPPRSHGLSAAEGRIAVTATARPLLIELGTEELPPRSLAALARALRDGVQERLASIELADTPDPAQYFHSPRRLAVIAPAVRVQQPERRIERAGPALSAAFDAQGRATKAAQGFARSCGVEVGALEQRDGRLLFSSVEPGKAAADLIPGVIAEALAALPVTRRMRWGRGTAEFVRPVHWLVLLLGSDVVDCEILGVRSGRATRGHRHHYPGPIELAAPAEYNSALRAARVFLNDESETLCQAISGQVRILATEAGGVPLHGEPGDALVAEVAALVEWPVALRGSFDPRFLSLPEEVLIATLEGHQRYFPVRDARSGRLLPHFIAVANIESSAPDEVRRGNERVVVPRLSDAMFFWETDRAARLDSRIAPLDAVVFQNRLGTLGAKTRRVAALAESVARGTGGDPLLAWRAAELCKCDLLTRLVSEFPELQGTVGRYLAEHDGEPVEVAAAVGEHYRPRFAGDALPQSATGRALAIADKVDTIAGIFAVGQAPSGEKDPFGLRRAALGVLRILIECGIDHDLEQLIGTAHESCLRDIRAAAVGKPRRKNGAAPAEPDEIFTFMMERLRRYYLDDGIRPDVFEAVLACRPTRPLDFHRRVHAVTAFSRLPEAESLAAANKRIRNILRQAGGAVDEALDHALLRENAEKDLAAALDAAGDSVEPLLAAGDYTATMSTLAGLRDSVDAFFDHVMVMVDDEALRNNRLALLSRISRLFLSTADISCLQSG
jgi:glycyl-tRNA synthetase beta chain